MEPLLKNAFLNTSSILTTPSAALRRLRDILLMPQPPLLYQEGTGAATIPDSRGLNTRRCVLCGFRFTRGQGGHVGVDHRREIERNQLREKEASDNGEAQSLAGFA